eukprot:596641-Pleurochrysis_carterae.AAC.2
MFKEFKDELANLHDAYESDEHERKIELMRDEVLPDNCSGQHFADKVNILIRDLHNSYIRDHNSYIRRIVSAKVWRGGERRGGEVAVRVVQASLVVW